MTWLSEIEERQREWRDSHFVEPESLPETVDERMACVLRELAGFAEATGTLAAREHPIKVMLMTEKLSVDAKELCVAARESSRERTDAGENNGTK